MGPITSIIYETSRWQAVHADGELVQMPDMYFPPDHPSSWIQNTNKFKPRLLVRVDDMETVPGSSVDEPYHALSYSWNQAGDISKIDKEKNKKSMEITHVWKDQRPLQQMPCKNKPPYQEATAGELALNEFGVSFKSLIQRICKNFNIRYIWIDQLCINQQDDPEKQNELKKLHCIYENARYTMALIPELYYDIAKDEEAKVKVINLGIISTSEWSKRIWTLEEAYKSRQILFIGRNVHTWSNITTDPFAATTLAGPFLYVISDKSVKWTASTALFHARTRQSTKKIDRYRALTNMFPDIFSDTSTKIIFGSDQTLFDIAIHFYGVLAKADLTILKFGVPTNDDNAKVTIINNYEESDLDLPTWTGIQGRHVSQDFKADRYKIENYRKGPNTTIQHDVNINVDGKFLSITCNSITVSIRKASCIEKASNHTDYQTTADGLPYYPIWMKYPRDLLFLKKLDSLTNSIECVNITTTQQEKINTLDIMTKYGIKATHILPVKLDGKLWVNTLSAPTHAGAYLSLMDKNCTECTILSGIQFEMGHHPGITGLPVVSKSTNGRYKAIGLCIIDHSIFTYRNSLQYIESKRNFEIE